MSAESTEAKGSTRYDRPLDLDLYAGQVALINGNFELPKASPEIMNVVRKEIQTAAKNILAALREAQDSGAVKIDGLFLSQGLLELQAAKDKLCCSVIQPYWTQPKPQAGDSGKPKEEPASKRRRASDEGI